MNVKQRLISNAKLLVVFMNFFRTLLKLRGKDKLLEELVLIINGDTAHL